MSVRTTTWYVKPLSDNTSEQIAAMLVREGLTAQETEFTSIVVNGKKVYDVYGNVPFHIITRIRTSDVHRRKVRVYVQEGRGQIRSWTLYNKRKRRNMRLQRTRDISC